MKFKKLLVYVTLIVTLLLSSVFSGCDLSSAKKIKSIEKTSTVGLVDTYTITYSDGSVYTFEITNGKDGEDAQNLSVEELYAAYIAENPEADFDDFLKSVTSLNLDTTLNVSNKALRSAMKVYAEFTEAYRSAVGFWGQQQTSYETAVYCGSAVVCLIESNYTYMITNYHVLYDEDAATQSKLAERIVCYLYGSESEPIETKQTTTNGATVYDYGDYGIECEYVGGAITLDLAVIKARTADVKKINPDVEPIEFAKDYHVGETAIAIGNSEDEGISVTKGIVSVDNEYINYAIDKAERYYRSMRIDTAIYGGNSGGGLFDSDGKLIGITNAGDSEDQNINYAIPVNVVKPVVENIIHYNDGGVKVLKLGVTVASQNGRYVYDAQKGYGDIIEDVICSEITDDSLADKGFGLEVGDKLVALNINGVTHEFNRYFNLGDLLYTVRQGDVVSFIYYRNDEKVQSIEYQVTKQDLVSVA